MANNLKDLDAEQVIKSVYQETENALQVTNSSGPGGSLDVIVLNSLVPEEYDYVSLSYTGDNLTGVVYKTGGAGGVTVATLTLAYTGDKLISITRS